MRPRMHGHSVPYAGPTNHEAELAAGYGWRVVGWVFELGQLALVAGVIGWLW